MDAKTPSDAESDTHEGILSLARELMSAMEAEQVPDHLRKLAEDLAAALVRRANAE